MEGKLTSIKITETIHKIENLKSVKRHYDVVVEELEKIYSRKNHVEDQMIKELEDVTRLEKMSVKSIFHNVLGNKNEQLEKERQEYLQVVLQHKDILNAIEVAEFEKDLLEKKVAPLNVLQSQLNQLKITREGEILASNGSLKQELLSFEHAINENTLLNAEQKVAIYSSNVVIESLTKVLTLLKKVKNWRAHQNSYGRNPRYRKNIKLTSIDHALKEVARAQLFLQTFNKDLASIGYSNNRFGLQIDYIAKFPMVLFDNLISDWILQEKIKTAFGTVSNLKDDVRMVASSLQKDYDNTINKIQSIESQKEKFLEEN